MSEKSLIFAESPVDPGQDQGWPPTVSGTCQEEGVFGRSPFLHHAEVEKCVPDLDEGGDGVVKSENQVSRWLERLD